MRSGRSGTTFRRAGDDTSETSFQRMDADGRSLLSSGMSDTSFRRVDDQMSQRSRNLSTAKKHIDGASTIMLEQSEFDEYESDNNSVLFERRGSGLLDDMDEFEKPKSLDDFDGEAQQAEGGKPVQHQ